jgi:hypothetical protein
VRHTVACARRTTIRVPSGNANKSPRVPSRRDEVTVSRCTRSSLPALIAPLVVALLAVGPPITAAHAAAGPETIRIRYSDFNLSTTAGVEAL